MKRILLGLLLAGAIGGSGCCTIDRKAVSDVAGSYEIARKDHLARVEKDPALSKSAKEDWLKFYDSWKRLIEALKRATE